MLFQHQVAEALFEPIDLAERRELVEVALQLGFLVRIEVMAVPPHQREQAAMLGSEGIDFPPTSQELMVDEADDVETVGHNLGLGKMLAHDGAIDAGQVHADDPYTILTGEFGQVVLQSRLTAAEHNVEDGVAAQVTEGGGVAILLGKEVFIDAEDPRAGRAAAFGELSAKKVLRPALDGGAADCLALGQPAAVDSVVVRQKDAPAEWFGGAHPGENAGEPLPESPGAVFAAVFAGFQLQDAMPQTPTLMPGFTHAFILAPQALAAAIRARRGSEVPHRDPEHLRSLVN